MAAALPSGNLIVPVIKNADQLSLVGISKSVNDLAGRARANQLKPDDIQGATFTFTNIGAFGNIMGVPIINQPQAAILAVGAIKKKPAIRWNPGGWFRCFERYGRCQYPYVHYLLCLLGCRNSRCLCSRHSSKHGCSRYLVRFDLRFTDLFGPIIFPLSTYHWTIQHKKRERLVPFFYVVSLLNDAIYIPFLQVISNTFQECPAQSTVNNTVVIR